MSQVYKIGRSSDNNLVLNDKLVEEFHAHLFINDKEQLVLLDLKSKYGSLVNGARVDKCLIRAGDQVQIGFSKIDWEKIAFELRANQNKVAAVKKMTSKVFTEVETNYSGEASFKLATEAIQKEIAPKVIPIEEKTAIIEVSPKPEKPEKTTEDEITSLISEQLNVPPTAKEIPSEVHDLETVSDPIPVPVSPPITDPNSATVSEQVSIQTSLPISVLEKNTNTAYNRNTSLKARSKQSLEEMINNVDSLYLFLIIMLLTMFFLGWVISIIT